MKYLFELLFRLPKNEQLKHPEISNIIEIGKIHISTNKIIACDPLLSIDMHTPFSQSVPNGDFSTKLYYGRELPSSITDLKTPTCFCVVEFSDEPISYWKLAVAEGLDPRNLDTDEYYGFEVQSGLGCFKDLQASKLYSAKIYELLYGKPEGYNFYTEYFEKIMDKNNQYDYLDYKPNDTFKNNVIFFDIGNESIFPSYFGYNENNQPVCLLTDCLVFDRVHLAEYLKNDLIEILQKEAISLPDFISLSKNIMIQSINYVDEFENPYTDTHLEYFADGLFFMMNETISMSNDNLFFISKAIDLIAQNLLESLDLIEITHRSILQKYDEPVADLNKRITEKLNQ